MGNMLISTIKKSLIGLFIFCAGHSFGQSSGKSQILLNPEIIPIEFHGITGRLDEYVEDASIVNEVTKGENLGYDSKDDWYLNPTVNPNALPKNGDPALQREYAPFDATRAISQNFNGMGYTGVNPADPSVDVGPNHIVQMINGSSGSYIQVYNKSTLATMLPANTYFDNFMSMAGGAGDPIVMYDERANRWVLTEFSASGNNMHVAVSTTPDPTGTYYKYTFNAPNFPDYPKYSIWTDAYIVTTNESGNSPVYALNRTTMLTGTAGTAQRFTVPDFGTIGFQAATPVSLNGLTNPPAGTPAMVMRMRDDAWTGAATDALELWEYDIDWVTPANTSLTLAYTLGIAAYESELCGYTSFACIDQPGGGTQDLDPLREVLMNRIHYRNFGTYESIVCCHVADVDGTDHAGVRWYELRRTGGTGGSWAIYQQGTYAPDAADRWMPSIGISATGDILVAYNVADETNNIFPSLRYTGRKECDPLNTMTMGEATIIAGTAANASNRWGDYNQMGLDPSDGITFWFTGMYNPATQWSTRIAALTVDGACSAEVMFDLPTYTVSEPDANVSNGCLDYYVINVPVSIAIDPTQPADITVNVSGGTATQGVDFDIFNTTFTLDGATLTGTVQVWVYNDNNVEGTETIVLDYTLNANGGDAAAGTFNQTCNITINDDDLDPASMVQSTVLLTQNFESGLAPFTTVNLAAPPAANLPFQIGNEAAAQTTAYNIPSDNTTQFAYVNDDACNCNMNDVYLYFPVLNLTGYTGGSLAFDSYYEANTWSGDVEDAEVRVSIGGGPYTYVADLVASGIDVSWTAQNIDITPYAGNASVQFAIYYSDGTGWLYGLSVDNIVVTGTSPIDIQQAVNTGSGMTANLGPNETVHFYDPATGDVMITLENTSSWDYGCVDVEVDRDGTAPTALQFTTANTADYLHSKTYTVVPTTNNPTGTFNVTLYYKEAEVAAWEAFTGNSRNNAEIIKVAGNNRIGDVNPGNYTTFTIDNVGATLGSFNSDVTFTAAFTNGFSGFGVGIYPVSTPVTHTTVNTDPTCNGASDGSIVITASGGDGNYTYSIDGGGSYQASNSFTGLPAGSYDVIVMDGLGATSTLSVEVLSDPAAVTPPTAGSNSPLCEGDDLNLTASFIATATYNWSGPGGFTSTNQNPTINGVTTAEAGTYSVTATVSGCTSAAATTSVVVNAAPAAPTAGSNSPLCEGDNLNLTASFIATATYNWSGPGGFTSTNQNPTINGVTTAEAGTYSVTATVSGCTSAAATTSVVVNAAPAAPTAGSNSPLCEGDDLNLTASFIATASYNWSGPGGFTSTNQNPTINGVTTAEAGTYSVTATVSGCTSAAATTSVVVNTAPAAPTAGSNSPLCEGDDLNLTASFIATATYNWSGPGGFTSTNQNPTINGVTTAEAGTYSVTATVSGCTSAAATTSVVVNAAPAAPTAGSNSPLCVGDDLNLTASFIATATYNWSGPGGFTSTNQNPTINGVTTAAAGTYSVTATVSGCTSTAATTSVVVNTAPTFAIGATTNPTTCLLTDGTIELTGLNPSTLYQFNYEVDGVPVGSFMGTTGAGGAFTIGGLDNGTYTNFTVTLGCTGTVAGPVVLTDPSAPAAPVAGSNSPVCEGDDVNLTASLILGATYNWSGPGGFSSTDQNPTINGVTTAEAGTYSVTATVSGCTSAAATTSVVVNSAPAAPTAASNSPLCEGDNLNLTASFIATATYNWSGPGGFTSTNQNPTINGVTTAEAGTYSVTATLSGCTSAAATTSVVVNAAPATPTAGSNSPLCEGDDLNLTASFIATATYNWSGPGGFTSTNQNPTINGVTTAEAGTYSVTATVSGCTSTAATTTVVVNAAPAAPTASSNSPLCEGDDLNLTASFIATATYNWSGPGGFTSTNQNPTINGVTTAEAGTYSVTATVTGCTSTAATTTVTVNTVPALPVITTNSPVCVGQTITFSTPLVTGATYAWSNMGVWTSTLQNPTRPNATVGMGQTYFLSITVNGCTSPQASSVVVVNPVPAAPTAGSNSPLCAGDDLNLTASFIATATYNWSGPGGFTTTGQNPTINGVTTAAAGTYSVTATVSGCTSTAATTSVVVNSAPVAPTAGSNSPVCVGGNINLTASGITSATYSWSGPNGFSSSLQNPVVSGVSLSEAGVYSVTATVSGCTGAAGTTTVVVNTPPAAPTAGNNGPVCEGSNLGLTASLIPTATYTWTGPNGFTSNFQNPNVLSATTAATGVYTVIATVGGCASAPATTSAIVNATPVFSAGAETNPTACLVADGTITLTGLNASTSYDLSYEFNGAPFSAGSITTNASGNYVITGLAVGSYTNFEITFAGCTGSDATVILLVDPAGPNVTVSVTDPSVPLACDGSATANISGGTSPYSQLWDDPLNQTSVTATALCDGTYCVRVTDAAGCISTACGTLTDPTCTLAVTETYTDIQCSGDMNGTISFAVSGASGAVSYSINSGGTFTGVSSYTNLGPGTYDWVVQDLAGCVVTGSITLTDPLPLALTVNSTNTNCAVNNGEIDITATGGTGALNYSVNNGASFQATGLFTGLGGATYPLLVEDANGCQATGIATIGVDGIPLIDSVITTDVTCYQGNDGTVTVYATTTTSPVVYSIDGGATFQINNPVFTSVPFGSYNIVVIEINGCQSVSAAFVNEPNPITYTAAITEEHCGLADGSMVLTTSVGLAPYTYSIDNGTTSQSGDTFNGISAGAYQVLITDSNGCSASGVEYVASLGGPAIDAVNTTSVLCNGDTNGTLTVVATGGTTPYEYSIDTGATFQTADSFTSLTPGNYQVIVTDASGCTDTSATLVTEPVALQLSMNATQALCDIDNATASVLATGGTQPYGYIWNDNQGQTAATATLLSEGIYTVLVTDANGCMITDSVEVTGTDSLFIEYQVTHESCNGLADGSIAVSVSGGTGAFTYLWNNGDTTASISGLEDGMFILEVTDSVGCSSTALVEVKTINVDCIEIPTAISPNADGVNDVWIIKGLELYPEALIEIYNKWGNLLYSNNSYQNDWDGKYQGTDLPAAVYYFIIKLDEETVHTGSLTIIR